MKIDFIEEFQIGENIKIELVELLALCFSETAYRGRTFFKQLPHYRLILTDENKVIGQVAIDYRIMNLNGEIVRVFGVIDLAIYPKRQGEGLGTKLMLELEKISSANQNNIDFLFLVTDKPAFYERLGYKKTKLQVTWLKINQGKNHGLTTEEVNDCDLMFKEVSGRKWSDGQLDMLGYWY